MSQISPPIRILLVLAVAVLGVYMLFLKPKPEDVPPVEPATTTTSEPVEVDAGETAAGTATTQQNATEPATAVAAAPKDLKGLPKPVRRAIRDDKVLVLLFWNDKAADDRSVRESLRRINTWDGRVFVHAAPLKRISRYGRIARGVSVEQSPTIVIADRDLKAETLVGYVDRTTIDQAVVDALRNSNGLFTSAYLRKVDEVCVDYSNLVARIPYFYMDVAGTRADRRIARVSAAYGDFARDLRAVKAPKRWSAFKSATLSDLGAATAAMTTFSASVTPKTSRTANVVATRSYNAKVRPAFRRLAKRFDGEGLFRCRSQF